MSRSTLTFSLIVELLLAPAAFAAKGGAEKCLANCDTMHKKFEKACKTNGQGGRCEGRGKTMVDDLDKRCKEECAKRKK